ncbi:MAG: tRNA (guanosine(46)-N7)-methyltransferase TrmB [Planctomycetes bacterium]|nr:tRNA (guanosine(46)-N7)-methyltransferase TrmB [Planctomycetota bacterium]
MSRLGKRKKWELNTSMPRVFEPILKAEESGDYEMKGHWHERVFDNDRPITIELGCGKGLFLLELARRYPERNFVGVDLKGHRFFTGAQQAEDEGLTNIAFLRLPVEMIERVFAPGELSEFWLTFSDPQPKDFRDTKRITSPIFMARYLNTSREGCVVHIKTDSALIYRRAKQSWQDKLTVDSTDVHGELLGRIDEEFRPVLEFQSPYEKRWVKEGRTIYYLRFPL